MEVEERSDEPERSGARRSQILPQGGNRRPKTESRNSPFEGGKGDVKLNG